MARKSVKLNVTNTPVGLGLETDSWENVSDIYRNYATGFGTNEDRTIWKLPKRRYYGLSAIDIEQFEILFEERNVATNIIELLPNSMGLKTPEFSCEDPDFTERINKIIEKLIPLFTEATKISRLTGGSIILINNDEDITTPLIDSPIDFSAPIEGGSHYRSKAYVRKIDKTNVFSSNYGKPLFYGIKGDPKLNVHYSRVLHFNGGNLITDHQKKIYKHWGVPVLNRCLPQINALEVLRKTIENSIDQFSRLIIEVSNYYDLLKTVKGRSELKNKASDVNFYWNILRALVTNKDDKIYNLDIDFSKLVEIIPFVLQDLASTCDIPYSILYNAGSSSGLSSGLDSGSKSVDQTDERQWSNYVQTQQVALWKPHLDRIIRLMMQSELGEILPYDLKWTPLLQLSEAEQKGLELTDSEIAKNYTDAGVILSKEVRESLNKGLPLGSVIDLSKSVPQSEPTGVSAIAQISEPGQTIETDDSTRHKRLFQWYEYTIGIQYQQFDKRFGKPLPVAYGGIERTTGEDGMNCDVYVGMHHNSPTLYRFTLTPPDGDAEYKYGVGFNDLGEFRTIILSFIPSDMVSEFRQLDRKVLEKYRRDNLMV